MFMMQLNLCEIMKKCIKSCEFALQTVLNLMIHIMALAPFQPFAIPNENIHQYPGGQQTNPNDVTKTINGNRNFIYAPGVLGRKRTPQGMPSTGQATISDHFNSRHQKSDPFLGPNFGCKTSLPLPTLPGAGNKGDVKISAQIDVG